MFKISYRLILFVLIFGAGLFIGKTYFAPHNEFFGRSEMALFFEGIDVIENKYINNDSLERKDIMRGAVSGMVEALNDPPSVFFEPGEAKRFLEDTRGAFEGVGMEIGIRDNQLTVVTPLKGTPAEEAGLRAGDKIVKIDDVSTMDIKIEEAVSLIRGEKGTKVALTIIRKEWDKTKEVNVVRDVIEIPSLEHEMLEGNIAHIRLIHFSSKTSSEFSKLAKNIMSGPTEGIILDLRNNPGGYLEESKKVADWFLDKGDIVTIQESKDVRVEKRAQNAGHLAKYPIIILINQGSASASEILASAIRDNLDATIVGEQSYGKGSVQELVNLSDGSAIKITIARWLTPEGELIEEVGITPDIIVEMSEEDYEAGKDPQLEKAIEILKDII